MTYGYRRYSMTDDLRNDFQDQDSFLRDEMDLPFSNTHFSGRPRGPTLMTQISVSPYFFIPLSIITDIPNAQTHLCFTCWMGEGRVVIAWLGLRLIGGGHQLVPADRPLTHVDFIQPDVGFTDQGLLHELPSVWYQEQLWGGRRRRWERWRRHMTRMTQTYCEGHLNWVANWIEIKTERLVEGRLSVVATHSRLLFYDFLLSCDIHHVEFYIKV